MGQWGESCSLLRLRRKASMKRTTSSAVLATTRTRVLALLLIAAVAAAVVGARPTHASETTPHVTKLHYTLHFSPFTMIDTGAKGNSVGDEIVSHDLIFSADGKRVGYDAQTCMLTSLRPPQLGCSLVFALPGGTITGQYIGAPPPHKLAAITGGTGKYIGAAGTIEVVESGHNISDRNTLTFTLLP
jgi:hypothetical protein